MSKTIQCSTISDIVKTFKDISDKLTKGINKLFDLGLKIFDPQNKDGQLSYKLSLPSGETAQVTFTPSSKDESKWDIVLTDEKSKKSKKYTEVEDSDADKIISDAIEEMYGVKLSDIKSSKRIKATFRKVTAAKCDCVELVSVNANYDGSEAWDDINTIVSDDAFVAALPCDAECSYEIVDEGSSFDVTPVDLVEKADLTTDQVDEIIQKAEYLLLDTLYISSNASGPLTSDIRNICSNIDWSVRSITSTMMDYSVEQLDYTPNPLTCIQNVPNNIGTLDPLEELRSNASRLISALQLYYCNITHDFQSMFDSWIRDLSHVSEYDLKQRHK